MTYSPSVIITYTIRHLKHSDKVRFFYALKGRGKQQGIIKDCKIIQLGKTVLLVKPEHEKAVKDFLSEWKCGYKILHCSIASKEL